MKISKFIEKYFWIFLIAGIVAGILLPLKSEAPPIVLKLLLGMMLFLVFIKIDALEVLENMKDLKLMALIAFIYMIAVPVLFYLMTRIFDRQLAIGLLLLTAMPAGVSSPALVDLLKGNIPLAMSIAVVTQIIAPFTVPLLFWIIGLTGLEINILLVFRDIVLLIFTPMILAQLCKNLLPGAISRGQHLFTSLNVFVLFSFVYVAISAQRDALMENPVSLIWKTVILYLVFALLHAVGYLMGLRQNRENRIAYAVTSAYMNNGMAIVLAAAYFGPEILILMVLSELPWNTLPEPFRRITRM
ncbi:MAG TPA: bile acid:sodium symporter [Bacteroidales bacterium]|jgi:BASS family bile acid:Na+ symporter|nr:bile acid:sodium symporter [Bacteroidales bacterium]HOS71717.1 bile acid:sodium symporter [Bacteroidales bacterium]HQH24005.1 bile acid:sodium symporter [Bacteroidales bacterium]HQJ82228.1 bile acid:sodium symporter [Bacteroidales bacterium]